MTADELCETISKVLPDEVLLRLVDATKLKERDRRMSALLLIRAMVLSAASPSGGRQADVLRAYLQSGAPKVVRGSFYDWFGGPLEEVMAMVTALAIKQATSQPRDLPGVLGCVKDWRIVDSTTVRLNDALKDVYPGTGDYAALKVHKTMSVGWGTTIAYHLSPAREHDSKHLTLDESWRGYGLLIDLGYASIERLRECHRFGVSVVLRLKENWQPKVKRVHQGELKKTFTPETDLDVLLADEVLLLNGKIIDADVVVGSGAGGVPMRLVGVRNPAGAYCFFLTNLPITISPGDVATLYRVRWEIEINNKLDKSSHRLEEIDARKPAAVRALIHASITSSIIICTLVNQHHAAIAAQFKRKQRTKPPLHVGLLARMISAAAFRIASALDLRGAEATEEWTRLAGTLVHMGEDPNWRRKPSVLDQLRGWKVAPGRPRNATKSAAISI